MLYFELINSDVTNIFLERNTIKTVNKFNKNWKNDRYFMRRELGEDFVHMREKIEWRKVD